MALEARRHRARQKRLEDAQVLQDSRDEGQARQAAGNGAARAQPNAEEWDQDFFGLTLMRNGLTKPCIGAVVDLVVSLSSLRAIDLSHNQVAVLACLYSIPCDINFLTTASTFSPTPAAACLARPCCS